MKKNSVVSVGRFIRSYKVPVVQVDCVQCYDVVTNMTRLALRLDGEVVAVSVCAIVGRGDFVSAHKLVYTEWFLQVCRANEAKLFVSAFRVLGRIVADLLKQYEN